MHFTQLYELIEKNGNGILQTTTESMDLPLNMNQASMVNRFTDLTCNELAESMFQPKGGVSNLNISLNNTTRKIIQDVDMQVGKEPATKQSQNRRKFDGKKSL